jgi:protein-S-isoprenylcysteine O-methyltransferase Ste14
VVQAVAFAGFLLYVVPSIGFAATGGGWGVVVNRERWQLLGLALAAAPVIAIGLAAVTEFLKAGGTPLPLDPPTRLVTTGPYSYVSNPMQLSGTILLIMWGIALGNVTVVLTAVVAAAFSSGVAKWNEYGDLASRFGSEWHDYRRQVRNWWPRLRPIDAHPDGAVLWVAATCGPCSEVATFFRRRDPTGLSVLPAEQRDPLPRRITYDPGIRGVESDVVGVAALAAAAEHLSLGWAVLGWVLELPGLAPAFQVIADAVGAGPRDLSAVSKHVQPG